jgi:CBS domain-containing protein
MLVKDVMTRRPVTVGPKTPLSRALALMDEHSVTMLPVVTPAEMIIGVLSEADVIRGALPTDPRRHQLPVDDDARVEIHHEVGELMSPHPVTVTPDTDLADAAAVMTDTMVKSLPVIDELDRVVGVVSRRDIVRVLARPDVAVEADVDDLFRRLGKDWLVTVTDGEASVTGPADRFERSMAEAAARSVPGIRRVRLLPG